jgi:membrane dipeptidase
MNLPADSVINNPEDQDFYHDSIKFIFDYPALMISRRRLLKLTLTTAAGGIFSPMLNKGSYPLFAQSNQEYSARAIRLLKESLVIDMLNQFKGYNNSNSKVLTRWLTEPGAFTQADAEQYLTSGINVFALGHGNGGYEEGIKQMADWNGFIAGYSQWLKRIDSADDLVQAKSANKIGILLSLQTSSHFRNPDDVDTFVGLGQRVSQLTHNKANLIGSSFFEPSDGGLTYFGQSIVKRMNEKGMGIDISHCGDKTTLDALAASQKPVVITHAACRGLTPSLMRSKTDEVIKKMAVGGGVMGIPFIRFMIREQEPVNLDHVVDHIDYMVKLVGIEHVGIGSDLDLDTEDAFPEDRDKNVKQIRDNDKLDRYHFHTNDKGHTGIEKLNHPKRIFDFTEGLIRRKYTDDQIKLILGGNFKRALSAIWSV